MDRPCLLVVDDDETIRDLLVESLGEAGYQVVTACSGAEAIELVKTRLFDAALLDIHMPGMDGLEVLQAIKRHDSALEIVMMTGFPAVGTAVQALKVGAYDYLAKPLNPDELRHLMARLMERRSLLREVRSLRSRLGEHLKLQELVGTSPEMDRVRETVAKVAATDSPVLIEGESGTGKELVAAAVHRLSARSKGPFIPVNCGAIPADLLESEFFGHVRGAFSGAVADTLGLFRSAHGGTLLLDEVAELAPALQVKLLRVLQDKEVRPVGSTRSYTVDVRIIAATNRQLEQAVRQGGFRQDLFYRLNVVRIVLPPLRERREDIPALVAHFIRELNQRFGREVRAVASDAMAALTAYDFPGNVRELENLLERVYALGLRDEIALADVPPLAAGVRAVPDSAPLPRLAEAVAQLERDLILRALRLYPHDKEQAARALGISPRTLYRRLGELGPLQ